MNFGARTLKTGLSVVLAIYIAKLWGLNPVIYAAVAASLTVMPSLYRSWKHILEQLKSNLIGATIALATILLVDTVEPWIVGVVIIISIGINISLGYEKSVGIVVLTIIAILESPVGEESSILFAGNRLLLIIIGIVSSVFVNMAFLPPKHENRLFENIKSTDEQITKFLKLVMMGDMEEKAYEDGRKSIESCIKKTDELYELFKEEHEGKIRKVKYRVIRKLVVYRKLKITLDKFHVLLDKIDSHYMNKSSNFPEDLQSIVHEHLTLLLNYKERILMKFDGKVKSAKKHIKNEELFENAKTLMNATLELHNKEEFENLYHILLIVSSLIEITNELNHLEKLVDILQTHHID